MAFFGDLPGDVTDEAGERNKKEIPLFHPKSSPQVRAASSYESAREPQHSISAVLRVRERRFSDLRDDYLAGTTPGNLRQHRTKRFALIIVIIYRARDFG